jgi:predicted acyltransferase
MYTQAKTEKTDPEGLLSTLPAIVTALLGYWSGLIIQRRGANWHAIIVLVACGLAFAAIGLLWNPIFPINKKLWTSSFVLLTGGLAMIGLAGCLALFDIADYRRLARPFAIVGVNAITIYVGAGLLARLLGSTHIGQLTTKGWIFTNLFTDHIADPKIASLGYALLNVAFWWLVAWIMARRGWSLRV